jgi:hypothetical protein
MKFPQAIAFISPYHFLVPTVAGRYSFVSIPRYLFGKEFKEKRIVTRKGKTHRDRVNKMFRESNIARAQKELQNV